MIGADWRFNKATSADVYFGRVNAVLRQWERTKRNGPYNPRGGTQHWVGKALPPSNGRSLRRALGAAQKRDRSSSWTIATTLILIVKGRAGLKCREAQACARWPDNFQ